ncbi:MAG: hypothetical protein DMF56_12845 [Acidobacteria bacterium]|nr:MAG: hypothetical protein DMF56_12845 [Acidobacteriota bacterium]
MFRRSLFLILAAFSTFFTHPIRSEPLVPCQLECTLPPSGPNDVFRYYSVTVYVSKNSRRFWERAPDCTLTCPETEPEEPLKSGSVIVLTDCSRPIPPPSITEANIVVRMCTSAPPLRDGIPDLSATTATCSPNVLVRVSNLGSGASPASVTKIVIASTEAITREVNTPALAAGESTLVDAGPLPSFCSVACVIRVVADASEIVAEQDKSNNASSRTCGGG